MAHDQIAHAEPNEDADEERRPHSKWRGPLVLKHQNAGDAAQQTDAASGRQINVTRENDEQHAHGQGGGNRKLGHEQGEIAGAKKLWRHDGEECADDDKRDDQREVAK